jgi:GNAT superfamily N-acetyltransferase
MLELKAVNGSRKEVKELLYVLQLEVLPVDKPADTTKGYWWILYDGVTPVGFAGLHPSSQWGGTGYLARAGVVKDYRGKGLQKRLIRVRERKARALGWSHLVTDTCGNPASANNLIACGYRMYEPRTPWGIETTVYWIKRLKKELK